MGGAVLLIELRPVDTSAPQRSVLFHLYLITRMSPERASCSWAGSAQQFSHHLVGELTPSLNRKMRNPNTTAQKAKKKKSSLSRVVDSEDTDCDAGADGDAENDKDITQMNGASARRRSANVVSSLQPIPEARRHSIAA